MVSATAFAISAKKGWVKSGRRRPMVKVRRVTRLRATQFVWYLSSLARRRTRRRVAALMLPLLRNTLETVTIETFRSSAMSRIVTAMARQNTTIKLSQAVGQISVSARVAACLRWTGRKLLCRDGRSRPAEGVIDNIEVAQNRQHKGVVDADVIGQGTLNQGDDGASQYRHDQQARPVAGQRTE